MSIRNLLPDSSVVLYAPSKPHILVAELLGKQLLAAFLSSLRKRVTQRSLRSRFRAFAPQMSMYVRLPLPVQARQRPRPSMTLSPLLVKPSSD